MVEGFTVVPALVSCLCDQETCDDNDESSSQWNSHDADDFVICVSVMQGMQVHEFEEEKDPFGIH